jgi:hypothetical protein
MPPRPLHFEASNLSGINRPSILIICCIIGSEPSANIPRNPLLSADERWIKMWIMRRIEGGGDRWQQHMSAAG